MVFQEFSKNCLNILMVQLFQHLLYYHHQEYFLFFFILNLNDSESANLSNLLFFDIPLLYYYIILNSSIICCLSSGDIYFSLGISISFLASSKLFFEAFVILSAILLAIKSPVASGVF